MRCIWSISITLLSVNFVHAQEVPDYGDWDGDGVNDYYDLDDDNDGIPDSEECNEDTLYFTWDDMSLEPGESETRIFPVFLYGENLSITVEFVSGSTDSIEVVDVDASRPASEFYMGAGLECIRGGSSGGEFHLKFTMSTPINLLFTDGEHLAGVEPAMNATTNGGFWEAVDDVNPDLVDLTGEGTSTITYATADLSLEEPNGAILLGSDGMDELNVWVEQYITGKSGVMLGIVYCSDYDGDGLSDDLDLDSDNDGIPDIIEAGGTDLDGDGLVDDATDMDEDGLADIVDSDAGGTSLLMSDTDMDGIPNQLDLDSDNDGILDIIEGGGVDADNDGIDDTYDIDAGGVPIGDYDHDSDGLPDYIDLNSDDDGEPDDLEGHDLDGDGVPETVPDGTDSDQDGLDDAFDVIDLDPGTTFTNAANETVDPLTDGILADADLPGEGDLDFRETPCFEGIVADILIGEPTSYGFLDGSIVIDVLMELIEPVFNILDAEGNVLNEDNSNAANELGTGWYYIFVEGDSLDCAPLLDSVFLHQPDEIDADLTVTDPLCFGDESGWVRVNSVYNATGDYDQVSFYWAPNPAGNDGIGADSTWNLGAGDYTLTINDENGCSKVFDFTINEPDSLFTPEFGFEHAYCCMFGYQGGNGVVYGAAAGGTPDYTYQWKNLDTDETGITSTWGGLNPGNYEFTATDENGCTLVKSLFLDSLNPVASFNVISDQLNDDCQGTALVDVEFENTSINFYNHNDPLGDSTFFWNLNSPNGDWDLTHDYFFMPDTIYQDQGPTYQVEVCLIAINSNGCADTACKVLTIYQPIAFTDINIFTPNGDNKNDIFNFEFRSASIAEFHCVIIDRWGVVIKELNHISEGCDGTNSNGNPVPDGVYYYVYKATTDNNNDLEGQGNIQVVR